MAIHASIPVAGEAHARFRSRSRAAAALVWTAWAAATLIAALYVRQYARNVPYFDDLTVVPVMTGNEPLTYQWATAQYNEHRNVIPRVLQVLLLRVIPDFRAPLYLNLAWMSAAAASAIVAARRLRGETRLVDAVLPLSILTLGQCECLLVGFCMTLVLTSWIGWGLIGIIGRAPGPIGWWSCLRIGGALVLLPLCGGSGIAMLPPLFLWLAGYVATGWWSGRHPGPGVRAIGLALLVAACAMVAWYLSGYARPAHIPPPPSASAMAFTTLEVCGLLIEPVGWSHGRAAGIVVALLSAATVALLATKALRSAEERPRALGLLAILGSILVVALSIGYSRSGIGPGSGWCSRYITAATPMLGVIYFAWLLYGSAVARRAVHVGLLAVVCAAIPPQGEFARTIGVRRRALYDRIEAGLQRRMPRPRVVDLACPELFTERDVVGRCFQMLKDARIGKFRYMSDDRLATGPDAEARLR